MGGANSKNNKQRHDSDARAFASGMDWNKLPKEILATLGIEPIPNNNENRLESSSDNSTTSPRLASKELSLSPVDRSPREEHSSDDNRCEAEDVLKPRRVSFKDTPEKIPHVVKVDQTLDEDPFKVYEFFYIFLIKNANKIKSKVNNKMEL